MSLTRPPSAGSVPLSSAQNISHCRRNFATGTNVSMSIATITVPKVLSYPGRLDTPVPLNSPPTSSMRTLSPYPLCKPNGSSAPPR